MRLVNINHISENQRIAKPIYDSRLSLILPNGALLTPKMISKLMSLEIKHVYIEDEISEGIVLEPMISDALKLQAIGIMKQIYEVNRSALKNKEFQIREDEIRRLKDIIDEMISEIYSKSDQKYYSTELLGAEMYQYNHAVEVMILSLLIGIKRGIERDRLIKLGIGAILIDIGKSKIAPEVVHKKGKLAAEEFEEMKRHVQLGYNMVKEMVSLSPISRQIILLHHEKLDGSGYPNGFTSDQIPLLVRIVTICDIFSTIVSSQTYNTRISVDVALEIIRSAAPLKLDADLVNCVVQVVDIYPSGTIVELNNSKSAIILKNNINAPTRPVLRMLSDPSMKIVDMMSDLTLFIKKVLPD